MHSGVKAYDHNICRPVAGGNQLLVAFGLIPVLQGLLVGKFYNHRIFVSMLAYQNRSAFAAKHDLRRKRYQRFSDAFDIDRPLSGVFDFNVADEVCRHGFSLVLI